MISDENLLQKRHVHVGKLKSLVDSAPAGDKPRFLQRVSRFVPTSSQDTLANDTTPGPIFPSSNQSYLASVSEKN